MFGRQARLPVDLTLGTEPNEAQSEGMDYDEWVNDHWKRYKYAYDLAKEHTEAAKASQKKNYDRTAKTSPLLPGERVLILNKKHRGRHKLKDRWEAIPHIVESQPNSDIAVYVVSPERGDGPTRTLHRDMLTPCTFAPREVTKRRRRDPPANEPNIDRINDVRSDNEGSDDDGDDQEIPVLLVTEPVEPVNVPIEPIMNEQVDNLNVVPPEPVEVLPDDEERNRYPIRANRGVPPDRYGNWQMKIEASPTVTVKSLRQRAKGFLRSAFQTLADKIDNGDEN
ncbi:Hypp3714 [Branchiostoma lanceolatum]|uniref:Hypp3714 protein n=1 Tax=Branchiostoma lanceolatum TaxID=7740 RepID=A0A8K0A6A5_BRALA|nr:Hypp3714 [Branchiostoma lanceolatum]